MGDDTKALEVQLEGNTDQTNPTGVVEEVVAASADDGGAEATTQQEQELDLETAELLADVMQTQAQVSQMMNDHQEQERELGGLKESLAAELKQLQDESFKLQLYGELEMLKRQVAALEQLDANLDHAEAVLNQMDDGTAPAAAAEDEDYDDEEFDEADLDPAEIQKLQDKLDAELAEMYAQLQAVRAEAATVAAKKASLEAELMKLLSEQGDGGAAESGLEDLGLEEATAGAAALSIKAD